jgi:hypothetical protein
MDPRVLEAMTPCTDYGNAASRTFSWKAEEAVD